MNETVFDRIIAGDLPADVVYKDDVVMAFRDVNPQAPVHVLVIPLHRITRFSELKDNDSNITGDFFRAVSRVASELNLDKRGYRIVINNGTDGGQEVEYLHAHILGGRSMSWPPG